MIHTLIYRRKS